MGRPWLVSPVVATIRVASRWPETVKKNGGVHSHGGTPKRPMVMENPSINGCFRSTPQETFIFFPPWFLVKNLVKPPGGLLPSHSRAPSHSSVTTPDSSAAFGRPAAATPFSTCRKSRKSQRIRGKPWENYGKTHEKPMENPWKNPHLGVRRC